MGRQLGFEELVALRQTPARVARREEVGTDAERLGEDAEDLERGRPRPGLDARDVRGGTAVERELTLRQARLLARRTDAGARRLRAVDMP